jgi:DNA-binding transcriptional ArsR family regulator
MVDRGTSCAASWWGDISAAAETITCEVDGMAGNTETDVAGVAEAIGHPARAAMLGALLGGEALTAGELARRAAVTAPTASEHLARLVARGLVTVRPAGRHRYFALAGRDVAAALESLARIAPPPRPAGNGTSDPALRAARTCYDHLAGSLGVWLADTLVASGIVADGGNRVTAQGEGWLAGVGIDVALLRTARRTFVRPCLDWTERRDHLAGAVGAALAAMMLERRWIARLPETRAVRLTTRGRDGLYRALGVEVPLDPHAT